MMVRIAPISLVVAFALVLASVTMGQPFVEPVFNGPVSNPTDADTPSRVSSSIIMGICTVAFLLILFITLTVVMCTKEKKVKEIDLAQPLILTEEVGKKKKKKGKKSSKSEELEVVELLHTGSSTALLELPPRVISAPPTLGSDITDASPTTSDEESEEESSETPPLVSDSDIYGSAQQ